MCWLYAHFLFVKGPLLRRPDMDWHFASDRLGCQADERQARAGSSSLLAWLDWEAPRSHTADMSVPKRCDYGRTVPPQRPGSTPIKRAQTGTGILVFLPQGLPQHGGLSPIKLSAKIKPSSLTFCWVVHHSSKKGNKYLWVNCLSHLQKFQEGTAYFLRKVKTFLFFTLQETWACQWERT